MKKLFLILVCCLISTYAYPQDKQSQDDDSTFWDWQGKAPNQYLPAMTKLITSANSPCNTGGEAFKDFIPRFRKDKAFRESRVRMSEEFEILMLNSIEEWQTGYDILKANVKNTKCDKSFGTWYDVSANEVCFHFCNVLLCSDVDGSALWVRFQRIDDKWYCTGISIAG